MTNIFLPISCNPPNGISFSFALVLAKNHTSFLFSAILLFAYFLFSNQEKSIAMNYNTLIPALAAVPKEL
jgi:hypothetical protein